MVLQYLQAKPPNGGVDVGRNRIHASKGKTDNAFKKVAGSPSRTHALVQLATTCHFDLPDDAVTNIKTIPCKARSITGISLDRYGD